MAKIGCFAPDHTGGEATIISRDEMFGCLVGFCDKHVDEWLSKDQISEVQNV